MTAPRDDSRFQPDPGDRPEIDSEASYGGADAVEKTTYVTGSGTDPEARNIASVTARVEPGGGTNVLVWAVIAVAVLVALVYAFGVWR